LQSCGEVHEIRHPECAFMMKSKMIVYYPDHVRSAIGSFVHINTSIETLQAN
jgi:hypothetical protein